MTQLFTSLRTYGFVAILLLSATVLGLAAYLASVFLPNLHQDFTIFAIIIPSLTIISFLVILSWSQPRFDVVFLFVLGVLWLTMGAWSADILGGTQCDALGGQKVPTKDGSISAKSYCYEMRVIEAFSWMLFSLFVIFLWILISLTTRAQALGRPYAWSEPIVELPWFGQWPGWSEGENGGGYAYPAGSYPGTPYRGGGQMPMGYGGQPATVMSGGYVVQQNPGHSVVIQPGANGQAPVITQVPGIVSSG